MSSKQAITLSVNNESRSQVHQEARNSVDWEQRQREIHDKASWCAHGWTEDWRESKAAQTLLYLPGDFMSFLVAQRSSSLWDTVTCRWKHVSGDLPQCKCAGEKEVRSCQLTRTASEMPATVTLRIMMFWWMMDHAQWWCLHHHGAENFLFPRDVLAVVVMSLQCVCVLS